MPEWRLKAAINLLPHRAFVERRGKFTFFKGITVGQGVKNEFSWWDMD
jgi:hypothetical protein